MVDIIKSHPFAEGFWPDHVARLGAMGSEIQFRPGEVIFHEGDHSSFFYLLISGNVALEVLSPGRPVRVATLYAGEVLGWSSVTGETGGKQFQARALEDVRAIAFDGARLRLHFQAYGAGAAKRRAKDALNPIDPDTLDHLLPLRGLKKQKRLQIYGAERLLL